MHSNHRNLIADTRTLEELFDGQVGGRVCAIDTEADSLHRYRESLCLVQFAWSGGAVLIDPLALPSLEPMNRYLASATVWMHGADYDMTMLKREFGSLPPVVFDTQIGARLLGVRQFGLANLVEFYFGIQLSKTSQKADWGRRPLPDKMMEYALNDVRYLLPMGEKIVAQLHEKGRYEWFVESCVAARDKVMERDDGRDDPWRVQGSGRLDRKGLHFLKALWHWRDREAEAWDRPSFMVATNRQLMDWCMRLAKGEKIEVPGHFRQERRKRLDQSIAEASEAPASVYPKKVKGLRRRRDAEFDRRVDDLLAVRDRKAAELDIEPSLIASRSVVESLAAGEDEAEGQLLNWQRECLGLVS